MNAVTPLAQLMPEVVATTREAGGEQVQLQLWMSEQLEVFNGHFADLTLAPGVAQVDWAVNFARRYLAAEGRVRRVEKLKFTCPITPATPVRLALTRKADTVEFRYFGQCVTGAIIEFSQGRLGFA